MADRNSRSEIDAHDESELMFLFDVDNTLLDNDLTVRQIGELMTVDLSVFSQTVPVRSDRE